MLVLSEYSSSKHNYLDPFKTFEYYLEVDYILQVNCIVFDKTGTLTIGKPVVVNTRLLKNMVLQEFYELVAATEVGLSP